MYRAWRNDQDRNGSAARRRLEFNAIANQIERRKTGFMARLQRRIRSIGDCLVYDGTKDRKGYARLNIYYEGKVIVIGAHRLFLILKLKRPIRRGYEAGHLPECMHRACVKHLREEHYKTNAMTAKPRDS